MEISARAENLETAKSFVENKLKRSHVTKVVQSEALLVFYALFKRILRQGYDEDTVIKVKTVKGNSTFSFTKKKLKKKTSYKAVVKAYVIKNGKKVYVRTSPGIHAYTSGGSGAFTNPKGVTLKKATVTLKVGKTYKIGAGVTKLKKNRLLIPSGHVAKLRYYSSSKKVATVTKSGKITAKSKGICKIYVLAANGLKKTVIVTVK